MGGHEAFAYIRYEFIFLLLVLIGLFVNVVFLKGKVSINWVSSICISLICIVVSTLSFLTVSILNDELNLSGEIKDTATFIAIIALAIINSIISYKDRTNLINQPNGKSLGLKK